MEGLIGGLALGLSATLFMYVTTKITGLSGIVEGLVVAEGQDWHLSYVLGLVLSGFICVELFPDKFGKDESFELSIPSLIFAGVVSGFGTRLSGGCTSGHGLCGLGRFSPRSLTSVLTFMATAAITSHITRLESNRPYFMIPNDGSFSPSPLYYVPTFLLLAFGWKRAMDLQKSLNITPSSSSVAMQVVCFLSALLFGMGLCFSGMADSHKVLRFLDFNGHDGWDPTLAAVLGGGLSITALTFPYLQKHGVTSLLNKQDLGKIIKVGTVPENLVVDWKLLLGSFCFGLGWGIVGICPGPGIVNLGGGQRSAIVYFPALIVGIILKDLFIKELDARKKQT